ncbi:MAG: hypothetical protein DIU78_020485 [Pseudomonadota bacterium]
MDRETPACQRDLEALAEAINQALDANGSVIEALEKRFNEVEKRIETRIRPLGPFAAQLASGALAAKNTGFVNGQLYADEVAEHALVSAQARLDDIHAAIREELDAASSYADFRARIAARYADMDPEELSTIVFAAMAMVELAGRAAVNEDL